jgi:hypothetical protein
MAKLYLYFLFDAHLACMYNLLRTIRNFSIKGGGVFKNVRSTFLNAPYPKLGMPHEYFMRRYDNPFEWVKIWL